MPPPPPSQPFMPLFAAAFQLLMDRECLILGGHEKSRRMLGGLRPDGSRALTGIVFFKMPRYSWKYRWMLARGRELPRARRRSFSCEPISRFRAVHHAAQSPSPSSSSLRKFGQLLAYLVSYLHALLIACVTCSPKFRSWNGRVQPLP